MPSPRKVPRPCAPRPLAWSRPIVTVISVREAGGRGHAPNSNVETLEVITNRGVVEKKQARQDYTSQQKQYQISQCDIHRTYDLR